MINYQRIVMPLGAALLFSGCALRDAGEAPQYQDTTSPDMPQADLGADSPADTDMAGALCAPCAEECVLTDTPNGQVAYCAKDGKILETSVDTFLDHCTITLDTAPLGANSLGTWPTTRSADGKNLFALTYTAERKAKVYRVRFDESFKHPDGSSPVNLKASDDVIDALHISEIGDRAMTRVLIAGYIEGSDELTLKAVGGVVDIIDQPSRRFRRCPKSPLPAIINKTPGSISDQTTLLIAGHFAPTDAELNNCVNELQVISWSNLQQAPGALTAATTLAAASGPISLRDTADDQVTMLSYLNSNSPPRIISAALDNKGQNVGTVQESTTTGGFVSANGSYEGCTYLASGDTLNFPQLSTTPAFTLGVNKESSSFSTSAQLTKGPGYQALFGNITQNSPQRFCAPGDVGPQREGKLVDLVPLTSATAPLAMAYLSIKRASAITFDTLELAPINAIIGKPAAKNEHSFPSLGLEGHTLIPLRLHPVPGSHEVDVVALMKTSSGAGEDTHKIMVLRVNRQGQPICKNAP